MVSPVFALSVTTGHLDPVQAQIPADALADLIRSLPDRPEFRPIFDLAARHPAARVRIAVCHVENLSPDSVRLLADDPCAEVRRYLVSSPALKRHADAETLLRLAASDPTIAEELAVHLHDFTGCGVDRVEVVLAAHPDPSVRLAELPVSFTERFLTLASLRQLKKGEFAHHLGDGPGSFYGIVSGALIVLVPMVPQGVQHGHLSLPGHWFGVATALTEANRHVALEAAVDTTLLTVPGQAVTALLADTPAFTRHMLGLVLANQLIAIRTAADLLIQEPRHRLVARLLTLSGLKLGEQASHSSCDLPLTQDQLAAMSCLSRNSVSRMLSELEHRGLVQQKYGMVHLSDRFELEATLN